MPTTAAATDAIIRPYPTRRLNHGPKVASAKDTMPSAKSPALVDRNAVAFNVGPSERRVRIAFAPTSGRGPRERPAPRAPGTGEGQSATARGRHAHAGVPAQRDWRPPDGP